MKAGACSFVGGAENFKAQVFYFVRQNYFFVAHLFSFVSQSFTPDSTKQKGGCAKSSAFGFLVTS